MRENQGSDGKASDALGLIVISFLILWFCQDIILHDQVPFFRDLGTYFYPLRFALYESLRSGELPLWNRHMAMGFPLLADFQSGVFYPPHLLLAVLPFFPAIRAIFIFHFLIAGVGSYKLCRNWKYPRYLSVIGALLFTLGGTLVSLSNLLNHFQTAGWLPWAVLAWEQVMRSPSWKNFLFFTMVTTIQFLAGSPELFALSIVLVLLDGFRIKASTPGLSYRKVLLIFVFANLLVVALAMAQLMPTIELFFESRRQQPIPPQEALHWSLKPVSLLNLFLLDKETDLSAAIGMRFFLVRDASFLISYYLGAISIFGISLWLCFSTIRERIALLGLVVASLIVAMGIHTPIYPFLYTHLPFLGAFRFPEKIFFFTYVLLLYMTLRGLGDLLLKDGLSVTKALVPLAAVILVWVGTYLLLRFNVDLVVRFVTAQNGHPLSFHAQAGMVAGVLSNLERQVGLSLGFLLLLVLAKTKVIRPALFGVLVVSTVFVDLSSAHRSFLFPLPSDFVERGQRVMRLPDTDLKRLFYYPTVRNLHPSSLMAEGQPSFKEAATLVFQNLLPNAGVLYGFDYMQEIDALARRQYTDFLGYANQLEFGKQLRLLRTFNVGYLVTFRPATERGITLVGHFPEFLSWFYKVEQPLPRVYVVNKSTTENNSEQILARLSSVRFDPTKEVILDQEIPLKPKHPLDATVKIVRYENRVVTIQTATNDDAILVLVDSYYPGWKVYVDGREEIIRRANLFFRAVSLPVGNHTVEFRYEPWSFKIGLIVSLTTVLLLVMISAIVYLRKSKHPAENVVTNQPNL